MGVYAPSPGTIYPRLARLEEEGLVTHDESDGRKVYRITEKGREELRSRSADLTELEDELTASVRDIAREVSEDVRETVRNLREELTWAARDIYGQAPPPRARGRGRSRAASGDTAGPEARPEADGAPRGAPGSPGLGDPATYRDLERLARHFTKELRTAAWQAQAVSEDAIGDLRGILDDALDRIKAEVFRKRPPSPPSSGQD